MKVLMVLTSHDTLGNTGGRKTGLWLEELAAPKVTGFANSQEEAMGLTKVVPLSVEDELQAKESIFSNADDWASYVVSNGLLITGQNPASSGPAPALLLERIARGA